MKLLGYKNSVKITNKSGGRIAMGKFALKHNDSKDINPAEYPDSTIKALDIFLSKGIIEVTPIEKVDSKKKEESNVVKKETLKNEKGEKHEHTVFDPEKAQKEKAIEVGTIEDNDDKAIKIENDFKEEKPNISKKDAEDFLSQHWKKIEKEVEEIKDVKKLKFILSIAKELGMDGNKKYELVEDRINVLK